MKKLRSLGILCCVVFAFLCTADTAHNYEAFTVANCYALAQQTLTEYYHILNNGLEDYALSIPMTDNLKTYVTEKLQTLSYYIRANKGQKEHATLTFQLLDARQESNRITLRIASNLRFNYVDIGPSTRSGTGCEWVYVFVSQHSCAMLQHWHGVHDDYDDSLGYNTADPRFQGEQGLLIDIPPEIFARQQKNKEQIMGYPR